MTTNLQITYDAGGNSHSASSCRLSMAETDVPATGRFVQQGATGNNSVNYEGVFSTQLEAVAAALAHIGASLRLVELSVEGGEPVVLQFVDC